MEKEIALINKYKEKFNSESSIEERKTELIPLLEEIQELSGCISFETATKISDELRIPLTHIYGVITFYNSLKLENSSKYIINVCKGTACHVNGADNILDLLKKEIQNQPENLIKIETVNCVGACSLAPVVLVNGKVYGKMDEKKVKNLVLELVNDCESV
jgi:NADH-quinone oxidoreductase subunit E